MRDFIKLYKPRSLMQVKLDDDKIKYIVREKKKGTSNIIIAKNMSISTRHVRRLWAKYTNTGQLPTMGRRGHPATKTISDEEVELVLAECKSGGSGVGRVTKSTSGQKHKRAQCI